MNNVVSFSGGRTSAYLTYLIKNSDLPNKHFVFMDTGAEHPKTYEFIKRCVDHFGIDLVCLRMKANGLGKGVTYEEVSLDQCGHDVVPFKDMMAQYGTPYIHGAFCTIMMKTRPYLKWLKDNFGDNHTSWLGIRADEPTRLKEKTGYKYLAELSDFDKQDILDWWAGMPFDLEIDSNHLGNCVFCIKKGVTRVALAAKDEPELAKRFVDLIASDSVRQCDREQPSEIMYRGDHSIKSIIDTYKDFTREELISGMRINTGACAESCEVFGCQVDMFDDY